MKRNLIQIINPLSGRYLKINTNTGVIVSHKKSDGAYKDVLIRINDGKKILK